MKWLLSIIVALSANLLVGPICYAQAPNLGLLLSKPGVSEGYTLFAPEKNKSTYLIDNCGEIVNEWIFSERPALACYLLEDGTLLRAGIDSLELRDWDNTLIWSYAMTDNGLLQHHDIEPLPNGNILCVITDTYTKAEIIAQGRDPNQVATNKFKLDKLVELQPVGTNDVNVVWEWKIIDHLVQDFDSTKPNYGVVTDFPELVDINIVNTYNTDWIHINSVDYNAALNQIIVSARHLSEIYIIDHSTTTAEAAGHVGGNSNLGGDLLWRWGNPQNYQQGGPGDQKLFLQHDARWVEPGYLDEGKISVYNNGGDGTGTASSVHLITPTISGSLYQKQDSTFLPDDYEWSWSGNFFGVTMLEGKKSGVHSLPNGNLMICQSSQGHASEITKNGDHLWSYKNPVGDSVYQQQEVIPPGFTSIFRAEKYPGSYAGFTGKDLTPLGIIEDQNSNTDTCVLVVSPSVGEVANDRIRIANPIIGGHLIFSKFLNADAITITDIKGRVIYSISNFRGEQLFIDMVPSMYFVNIELDNGLENLKVIVQ